MTNADVIDAVMAGVIGQLRRCLPSDRIVRNDSADEIFLPMLCVSPDALRREGDDEAWVCELQLDAVVGINIGSGDGLALLSRAAGALHGLELEGMSVGPIVEQSSTCSVAQESITYSSSFTFWVAL